MSLEQWSSYRRKLLKKLEAAGNVRKNGLFMGQKTFGKEAEKWRTWMLLEKWLPAPPYIAPIHDS